MSLLLLVLGGAPRASSQNFIPPPRPVAAFDDGRLLATSGLTALGGAAGGGLATWAVIGGYGSNRSQGATAAVTRIQLRSYDLTSIGAAIGIHDRVELSYAWLGFDTGTTGARLGLGRDYSFDEQSFGAKFRLAGHLVTDQNDWMPQTALGVQIMANDRGSLLHALGARSAVGVDYYIAATKLFLAEDVLADATLRFTRANQFGLLGFGGPRSDAYRPHLEGSLAWLAARDVALGGELRTAPDNLAFAKQAAAYDLFATWFASKHASVTVAWVALGPIATVSAQNGLYFSVQFGL